MFQKLNAICRKLKAVTSACKPSREHNLLILDDIFPHPLSAFRIAEYNYLLREFPNGAVYSTAATFKSLGESRSFQEICDDYRARFPELGKSVYEFNKRTKVKANLCYVMFLNNASFFIDYLAFNNIPFVLELYPGGGFCLNENNSDHKLKKVLSSPLLRHVVVTQKISRDYLVQNIGLDPARISYVYGGVFPVEDLFNKCQPKKYYRTDKETFDVCFVAHKYTPEGRDKGYDIFVECARILAASHKDISFHVVGPFDSKDIDVSAIANRITFYGPRTTNFFTDFYSRMDIILSPNIPNVLNKGAFDGFPTGACIEAVICGVAALCCDELGLNPFTNEELAVIPHDSEKIAEIIDFYHQQPEELYKMALCGQKKFKEVFGIENQMRPRMEVLMEMIGKENLL